MEWLSKASILAGSSIEIACNLGDALAAKGDAAASLTRFRHAVRLNPHAAETHARFGHALVALRQFEAAAASYRSSIRLRPDHASSHNNLGLVLQQQNDTAGATRSFQNALRYDADCADAHYNLGCLLLLDGRIDEARCCYQQANRAAPLHGAARWARCMVELPILYDTSEQITLQRHRYAQQLSLLIDAAENPAVARALATSIGASQPFFLPYQGLCDHELQSRYGTLLTRLLRTGPSPDVPPPAPGQPVRGQPVRGQPIRVGIVSGFFCEHTVWRLMLKGWLSQLDPARFQILVYYTGDTEDDQTALARRLCTRFVAGRGSDIRAAIQHDQPHVLLYPELGMDHGALRLAAERLAPVQCVAWGQPETSGLPTIDYFLSSALMEPDDAASHYTEKLITLPNLGIHYAPDDHVASVITRASLGLRPGATLFWCGQALYKYLPQNDDVFVRIAAAVEDCQFLFIGFAKSQAITQQFRTRLQNAFAARGLDAARYCVFLDPMPQDRFLATIGLADIMLDSIGWSGGKSTLDALRQAPVIVTHAGPLMRGRHTMAILTCLGVTETIAATIDAYVDIAVRLAADPLERAALRVRMAAGRHQAIGDMTSIRALESFLVQVVRPGG